MSSKVGIFFAGVGTSLVILAVGFAGGFIVARPAPKQQAGYQTRAGTEGITPVRVIMPASAEPAQPPQPQTAAVAAPEPAPQVQPSLNEVQAPVDRPVEKADKNSAESEERQHRRRYAQYKAKRIAAARARKQEAQMGARYEPGPMAYGDDRPRFGGGWRGN